MSDQPDAPRRRRRTPQQTAAQPSQGSAAKGVILVVVAVLVGFALLQDEDSSTAQVSVGADDDPAATVDEDDDTVVDESTSSSTTEAARPPADVRVLVANGSDVDGAARTQSDALEALNYVTVNPDNADEPVPETIVYFEPGYQAEAEVLADQIGATAENVTPLPTPAPVTDMQLANILVVLGPDVATSS